MIEVNVASAPDNPDRPDVSAGEMFVVLGRDGHRWTLLVPEPAVDLVATVAAQQAQIDALLDALGGKP